MATLLFWNVQRRTPLRLLVAATRQYEPDLVVLAECELGIADLLTSLNSGVRRKFKRALGPENRLTILTSYPRQSVRPVLDGAGIAIRHVSPPASLDVLVAAVHLPSKLFLDEQDHVHISVSIARQIEEAEAKVGHTRTIVLGDFNMNPFESGLVGSSGFHAVMSRQVATRGSRIVQGISRRFFYNPMWSYFGDRSPGPPGTYYYASSSPVTFYWNMFDQVLLRPELLPRFGESDLIILSEIAGESLLNANNTPDAARASDHLPILAQVDLNMEVA